MQVRLVVVEVIEESLARASHEGRHLLRSVDAERGVEEAADLAVAGFVDLREEELLGRDVFDAVDARTGGHVRSESVDVHQDLIDLPAPREEPRTGGRARDRALATELGELVEGHAVLQVGGIVGVEHAAPGHSIGSRNGPARCPPSMTTPVPVM